MIDQAIHADDGEELDAHFALERSEVGYALTYGARWGGRGAASVGNSQYGLGLRLLLSRIATLGGILLEVRLDSSRVKDLPDDMRVLDLGTPYPIAVREHDPEELRLRIGRAQAGIGRAPGARGSGNSTRRIQLQIGFQESVPALSEMAYAVATGARGDLAEAAVAVDTVAGRWRGQGFATSAEDRRLIEKWGMTLVQVALLEEGWPTVEDVSRFRNFDLLCLRPERELRVEVKATRGGDDHVLVTRGEVLHARRHVVDLAIVSGIRLATDDGRQVIAMGGQITWHRPWVPTDDDLTALAYTWDATRGGARG